VSLELNKAAWKRVAFGEVVRNVNDTMQDAEASEIDRVIAMEHMDPASLKIERWGDVADGTTFTRRVSPGQTLFGKRRAYQRKVAFADFSALCSGDIYTFEADTSRMLGKFLPFLVQSDPFFDHALDTSAGSLSPRTNWRDLAKFEFDLPPLDEQKRITDLLWASEASARALVECRRSLVHVRQVWVDDMVGRFLQAASVEFAETWAASPDSGYSAAPVDEETGRYVLSLSALGAEGYRPGNLKNVPDTARTRSATLQRGDLLISRANTVNLVGRVGIYSESRTDVSFPDTMMRLRLGPGIVPEFAAAVISSSHGRAHMRRSAAGSATSMVKINRGSLGRLQFPLIPIEDQREFLREVSRLDSAVGSLDLEADALGRIRRSVLAAVLGGS
jgi:type I restriction enzyme S subunit